MSRRRGRELAMQMLFQEEQGGGADGEFAEVLWEDRRVPAEARSFADTLFRGALAHREAIDRLIRESVHRWRLERIASVDRNILRMAVAEYLSAQTPKAIVIDEAVEIAKKYGSEKSAEFVNGILDNILSGIERTSA